MAAHVAGEPGAFRELYARYGSLLVAVLRKSLPQPDEALDLMQLTFLQVHRARHDYRLGARFRPWLFTIALNLKREHFRRLGRRPEEPLEKEGRPEPAADPPRPEETLDAARVRTALLQLPEGQRDVIALHWFAGLGFSEVARVVGASESAVKVRAHRGYERLRQILGPTEVTGAPAPPYSTKDSD